MMKTHRFNIALTKNDRNMIELLRRHYQEEKGLSMSGANVIRTLVSKAYRENIDITAQKQVSAPLC